MRSTTLQLLGLSAIASGGVALARPAPQSLFGPRDERASQPAFAADVLGNPCPVGNDDFGMSTAVLDFDGDNRLDVAVGVPGRGAVYVFYGTGGGDALYSHFSVHNVDGVQPCPPPFTLDDMGWDLAGGQLDGDAADELVVGAPRHQSAGIEYAGAVYVFGLSAPDDPPLLLSFAAALPQNLGTSVAIGDFDGDGANDVAAGAPKVLVAGFEAGQVMLFPGPFTGGPYVPVTIDNPSPVSNGNFGHDLAATDRDGDGVDDLFVSAVGNTGSGIPLAGQVFYFPGPVSAGNVQTIEDPEPNPSDLPSPRFGMSIDARGELLLVGTPRKDLASVMDTGVGYLFSGASFQTWRRYRQPAPKMNDFTGFRVLLADVVGGGAADALLVALPDQALDPRNRRAMLLFDGGLSVGGRTELYAIERSADHFGEGMSVGQLFPGGTEEILAGDPSYNEGPIAHQGRVVVYFRR